MGFDYFWPSMPIKHHRLLTRFCIMMLCISAPACFVSYEVRAQLQVTPAVPAVQLASTLAGPGVSVFNVTHLGDSLSIGSFSSAGTAPGLNSGILLSTGPVGIAIGPNSANNAGAYFNRAGDSLLAGFTAAPLFDASVLEFDFVPQSDTVRFRYVFASEEYPEFVCSNYNDIFAFFISGPGITGSSNMAVLPGSGAAVAINSINGGSMGSSVTVSAPCDTFNVGLYVDNLGGQVLQYDGYTAVMQAVAPVIPCETYHLKIVIADAGDGFYDSGVFLEAGSMVSTPVVLAGNDTSVCSGAQVQLGTSPAAGWTYAWTPATGLSSATSAIPILNAQNTGPSENSTMYVVNASNGSCVLTDSVLITVMPQPLASFVLPDAVCQFDTVSLTYAISSIPNAQINWVFGGNPSTQLGVGSMDLSWSQSGLFPVNLMVQQGICSDMFSDSIRVNPLPIAAFTGGPVSSCLPVSLQVQTSASNAGITIASANWTFGNGTNANGVSAQHEYTTPGSYAVGLSLCSDQGCCSDTLLDNYVNAFAVPRFTLTGVPPTGCVPHTATFSAQVDSFGVRLASADLAYGDGVEESGFSFLHTYTDTGSFDVSYSICTIEGCCSDTLLPAYIQTYPTPVASFIAQPLSGCSPLEVSFNGTIDTRGAVINSIDWVLGDGNSTSQVDQFTHRYEDPGSYSVELTVCSDQGCCADTLRSDYIEVYREPIAGFRYFPEEPDVFLSRITFQDESVFADSWEWSFGDGNTAQFSMPIHQYTDTGLYEVLQIVRTLEGCVDSSQQVVDIRPVPSVWIPSAFSPNNDGRNDVFAVKGDYLVGLRWRIYNRWGELIASGSGIGSSWDGTTRDEPVQEGIYLYEVETEDVRSGAEQFRGRVTLIR